MPRDNPFHTRQNLLKLLPRFALDEHEIDTRKRFLALHSRIELTPEQQETLNAFHSELVDALYEHWGDFAELQAIVNDEQVIARLKKSQLSYYQGLLSNDQDMQYVAERLHVGLVHERIGLDMKWYLGSHRYYLDALSDALLSDSPNLETYQQLLKTVFLDISLTIDAYSGASRQALEESEARLSRAMRGARDGLWDWNLDNDQFYASERWLSMLGLPTDQPFTHSSQWFERVHPKDRTSLEQAIDDHLQHKTHHLEHEYRIRTHNDEYLWVLVRGLAERDHNSCLRLTGSHTDIDRRKRLEAELAHAAQHDPLTQLGNRTALDHLLSQRQQAAFAQASLMFIDIDHFKLINDSLGHAVGDLVLIEASRRIQSQLQTHDHLLRFGGDEFVVISHSATPEKLATAILTALKPSLFIENNELNLSASIGIAPMNQTGIERYEPLQAADLALYKAKQQGRDQYSYYCEALQSAALTRLQLENELSKALERNDFDVHFQPIYNIRTQTPELKGVEALLRWQCAGKNIGPQEFVPILEQSDDIVLVGEWVLKRAISQVKRWHEQGKVINCSVNVSRRQLLKTDFAARVRTILAEQQYPADKLILELTEGLLMEDDPTLNANLEALAGLGIRIALDDFGTGYCSFGYLKRFPLHIIKVDKSFIQDIEHNQDAKTIARAIIGLGNTLDMVVIAEGVEQPNHIEFLMAEGCSAAQGYLFSKPQSGEQLERSWKIFSEHSEKTAEVEV